MRWVILEKDKVYETKYAANVVGVVLDMLFFVGGFATIEE